MLITCVFGLVVYPAHPRGDRHVFRCSWTRRTAPFRPLRLTDSLLGYMLMAFLFVVALHLTLMQVVELQHENDCAAGRGRRGRSRWRCWRSS